MKSAKIFAYYSTYSPRQVIAGAQDSFIEGNVGAFLGPEGKKFHASTVDKSRRMKSSMTYYLSSTAPGSAATMSSLMFSARQTMSSSALTIRVGRATLGGKLKNVEVDFVLYTYFTSAAKKQK